MKLANLILSVSFCCLPLLASGSETYRLSGHLVGLPDGTSLSLIPVAHVDLPPVAQTVLTDGAFTFEGTVEQPTAVRFIVEGTYTAGPNFLMLSEGEQAFNATVETRDADSNRKYYEMRDVEMTPSDLSRQYREIMASRDRLDQEFNDYHKQYADVLQAYSDAKSQGDEAKLEAIQASEDFQAFQRADKDFFAKVEKSYEDEVLRYKDSFWGPLAMISLTSYLNQDSRALFEQLSAEAQDSYYGKLAFKEMYPLGRLGDAVPQFTATDAAGNHLDLQSLCAGKKYLLLDFWASWCRPCRKEIPNLKRIYEKLSDKGFEILSVSIDAEQAPWLKAVEAHALPWPNVRDTDKSIASIYNVVAVPTMYVLDSQGRLVAENLRGEELAERLESLFEE